MIGLSYYNVLIIDFPGACCLRERLVAAGASVHVASPAAGLIWAQAKKIDAAFVSFESASTRLCEQLAALGVSQIIVTAEDTTGVAAAPTSWRSLLGPHPARRMEPAGNYLH